MKERMKKVTALCLAAALSVGTVLPVHAETVQDAQNAVDQLQQQKDSVQAEKTTVETELKKIAEEMEKTQSKLDAKQAEITVVLTAPVSALETRGNLPGQLP